MPVWSPKSKQELLGSHFYLHSYYNRILRGKLVRGWSLHQIITFHNHYLALFRKFGIRHNSPIPLPPEKRRAHIRKLLARRKK